MFSIIIICVLFYTNDLTYFIQIIFPIQVIPAITISVLFP